MQVKTQTQNGTTFTSTAVQSPKEENLSGDLQMKFVPAPGATVTSKLFTSGKMTHEAVLERIGVDGLKLTALGGMSSKENLGVASVEYLHKSATLTAGLDAVRKTANITATAGSSGKFALTAGVEAQYDTVAKEVTKCDVIANYSDGKDSEATLATIGKGEAVKLTYSHSIRPDLGVAVEFMYDRAAEAKLVTVGTKYEVDRDSSLKTKVSSDGIMSASFIQKIRHNTTLILSHRFDAKSMDVADRKIGLSLVIE